MPRGVYQRKKEADTPARVPFYQLVAQRMQETTNETEETLKAVYGTNDPLLIDAYERVVGMANRLAMAKDQKGLLKLIGEEEPSDSGSESNGRRGRRKNATSELYRQAVGAGWTRERFQQEYIVDGRQIGPWSRAYGKLKSK